MDLGTIFGVGGLIVALISLVYVRTQTVASRAQAMTGAEQMRIAQRVAALDVSMRLADRTALIRREMLEMPQLQESYFRANPALHQAFEGVGGMGAVVALRSMLDAMQDIYQFRKEGIINDAHWLNYLGGFLPYTRMPELRLLFDNAVQRGIYVEDFQLFCIALFDGREPIDPAGKGI